MDKEEHSRDFGHIAEIWGTYISMFITAGSLALDALTQAPRFPWSIVAAVAFVIFCILVWRWISSLDSELNDKKPAIDSDGDPTLSDVGMGYTAENKQFVVVAISAMTGVTFSNNPKPRTDRNHANGVRAEVMYLDENRTAVFPSTEGRWGETNQPSEIKKSEVPTIESVNFPNNGAKRSLALLIKYPEDDFCYAFNNESYGYPLFQNPSQIIKLRHFFVQIRLKGPYLTDQPWELEVVTDGKGDTYRIRKAAGEWQKMRNSQATKQVVPTTQQPPKMPSGKPWKLST